MPNQTKGGYRYKRSLSGATGPTITLEPVASNNTLAIFTGDVVTRSSGGYCLAAGTSDPDILGIMDGVEQYWDGENLRKGRYLPAATVYSTVLTRKSIIRVISAIDAVFEVDCDDTTISTEANFIAMIGENCDTTVTAGSTTTGQSNHCLDLSTKAATALQFRVLGISSIPEGPDFAVARVKVDVKVHESHLFGAGV